MKFGVFDHVDDSGVCLKEHLENRLKIIELFRIVRASGARRFGARVRTPLVGREEELDLLRRRWERAVRGDGQFVQIVGEAGIGKSRLLEEFRATLGQRPHTWSEFSSSQLLQNTPLHPVAEWGRQRFGVDEPADRRLADLENTLRLIGLDPAQHAPLLAPLVDIPLPDERAAKFAPERRSGSGGERYETKSQQQLCRETCADHHGRESSRGYCEVRHQG